MKESMCYKCENYLKVRSTKQIQRCCKYENCGMEILIDDVIECSHFQKKTK